MTIAPEQQDKIDKAIQYCQTSFKKFTSALEEHYGKKEADELTGFLLQNTYFAGGVFRSMFTGTPVNDIDIFFRTEEASIEFRAKFLHPKSIFNPHDISDNNTFTFRLGERQPHMSFVTANCAPPEEMLDTFDFTFNMHYYSVQDGSFLFDMDTFNMVGEVNSYTNNPINTLFRAYRFTQDGFKMQQLSLVRILQYIVENNETLSEHDIIHTLFKAKTGDQVEGHSSKKQKKMLNDDSIRMSGVRYSDKDLAGGGNHDSDDGVAPKKKLRRAGQAYQGIATPTTNASFSSAPAPTLNNSYTTAPPGTRWVNMPVSR